MTTTTMTTTMRMRNNFHFDGLCAMVMVELRSIWAVAFAAIAEMLGASWAFGVPEFLVQDMFVSVLDEDRDDMFAGIDPMSGDWTGIERRQMTAEAAFKLALHVIRQKDCDRTVTIWTGNRRTLIAERCEGVVKFEINRL